jgi:hypothetical protein
MIKSSDQGFKAPTGYYILPLDVVAQEFFLKILALPVPVEESGVDSWRRKYRWH